MRSRDLVAIGAVCLVAGILDAAPAAASGDESRSDQNTRLVTSFDGLNHYAQRTITGASSEPPQQGLCAGNGFVLESVSGVLAVYDTAGNRLQGPVALNAFYAYPPARAATTTRP